MQRFEFVLSPTSTKAVHTILKRRLSALPNKDSITALEVSGDAMAVAEAVALRIHRDGGFGLFVDYGRNRPYDMSLNAIRGHQGIHPLQVCTASDSPTWPSRFIGRCVFLQLRGSDQMLS